MGRCLVTGDLLRRFRRVRPERVRRGQLAAVTLSGAGEPDHGAWLPVRGHKLAGGRRWVLGVAIRDDVAFYRPGHGPVERAYVEDALDLLTGEYTDTAQAITALRAALGQH